MRENIIPSSVVIQALTRFDLKPQPVPERSRVLAITLVQNSDFDHETKVFKRAYLGRLSHFLEWSPNTVRKFLQPLVQAGWCQWVNGYDLGFNVCKILEDNAVEPPSPDATFAHMSKSKPRPLKGSASCDLSVRASGPSAKHQRLLRKLHAVFAAQSLEVPSALEKDIARWLKLGRSEKLIVWAASTKTTEWNLVRHMLRNPSTWDIDNSRRWWKNKNAPKPKAKPKPAQEPLGPVAKAYRAERKKYQPTYEPGPGHLKLFCALEKRMKADRFSKKRWADIVDVAFDAWPRINSNAGPVPPPSMLKNDSIYDDWVAEQPILQVAKDSTIAVLAVGGFTGEVYERCSSPILYMANIYRAKGELPERDRRELDPAIIYLSEHLGDLKFVEEMT